MAVLLVEVAGVEPASYELIQMILRAQFSSISTNTSTERLVVAIARLDVPSSSISQAARR